MLASGRCNAYTNAMLTLDTEELTLEFLDPAADLERLGPRYCWGGYLWQVRDAEGRPWLSGPQFPLPEPIPFHGQGMPEVFRFWDKFTSQLLNIRDGWGVIIGVGEVRDMRGQEPVLGELCAWEPTMHDNALVMTTKQGAAGWAYALDRTWQVQGQVLTSSTRIESTGDESLAVHWYPHPFFPLVDQGMRFRVTPPLTVEENPGFAAEGDGYFFMKPGHPWREKGHFEWFVGDMPESLSAELQHPVTNRLTMSGSFPIAYMPVWANASTISLEPHSIHTLAPGESAAWSVHYAFGRD